MMMRLPNKREHCVGVSHFLFSLYGSEVEILWGIIAWLDKPGEHERSLTHWILHPYSGILFSKQQRSCPRCAKGKVSRHWDQPGSFGMEMHMTGIDNTAGDMPKEASEAASEQFRAATHVPMTEEQMRATQVGELAPLVGRIQIVDYDAEWPRLFESEAERIQSTLGYRVLSIEHVGSTSVPGLAAKPKIDILLVVADSADEQAYVPALEAAAYVLRIREPDWYEHRMLKGPGTDINLHVFSSGCPEIDRMLLFRDWLRSHAADRRLYERTKRELVRLNWKYTQNYADAKTAVVEEILARARRDGGEEMREDDY